MCFWVLREHEQCDEWGGWVTFLFRRFDLELGKDTLESFLTIC